jgi:hypothetical protein
MAQSDDAGISPTTSTAVADVFPTHNVGKPEVREMPAEPKQYWRLIGPGIIAAGVGLASGEFILYPYIASQVGLVFVWAALVGLATQFFLNMEIERYTLATGETALTGFSRFWRHWGLVFAILTYFANLWPGWATSSATLISYLFGGEATWIAIGILLVVGLVLTLAPVVYTALERAQMLKVALVLTLIWLPRSSPLAPTPGPTCRTWSPGPESRPNWASPCCSARWPSPGLAAGRTCASPTGSGTRASAWAAICRGWPVR